MGFDFLDFFLIAFPTIFTIVDPPGALPPFLAMTAHDSLQKKIKTARTACLVAGVILICCAMTGSLIFKIFGFTIPALKIAGGLLLFKTAVDMLHAKISATKTTQQEEDEGLEKDDIAIFPMAVPLLSGPGAIASVLILTDRARGVIQYSTVFICIIVVLLISYFILKNAEHVSKLLGRIGISVFSRLMGLVLAALSVQFVLDGIAGAYPGLFK